jgi:putative two-component system response regulator
VEKNILLHRIALHLRFSFYQKSLERKVSVLSDNLAVSFAELIECRDEGTGGHVMRTAMYVEKLGREVIRHGLFPGELSEDELAMIVRAAPLHDIGKIGIKDSILLKPGKLDNDEFAVMKRHAALGEEILEGMYKRAPVQSYLQYASIIAASHHEKYDGTGYPRHMEGRGIPLCGRIMAVADVYDSLVDTRVYRKAMSHEEACAIILDGKGGHFDPDLVEIFDSCHRDFLDMFSRSQEA